MRITCCWSAAMLVLTASAAPTACAQNYPARPIRLIVPQTAGGSNDIMVQHFASALFRSLSGQDLTILLYKGGFPAMIDVMGGQAHMTL